MDSLHNAGRSDDDVAGDDGDHSALGAAAAPDGDDSPRDELNESMSSTGETSAALKEQAHLAAELAALEEVHPATPPPPHPRPPSLSHPGMSG